MKYFLLLKEDQFFDCTDPDKFHERLTEIANRKGVDVKVILDYYLEEHLKNIAFITFENTPLDQNMEQLLINAHNMTELLKKWTNAN